eukprot:TRINITY_DN73509_c0_g1_i4.p2 TRINITY_DN73509_c0_g1~~TRINITY_DN73509_c0_g1_i4.p2  ORF type:complete len:123 (-),score=2.28 TRINITY_DN73509_c0_g1_i4:89-457(-)
MQCCVLPKLTHLSTQYYQNCFIIQSQIETLLITTMDAAVSNQQQKQFYRLFVDWLFIIAGALVGILEGLLHAISQFIVAYKEDQNKGEVEIVMKAMTTITENSGISLSTQRQGESLLDSTFS